jgi:hypothetical protein
MNLGSDVVQDVVAAHPELWGGLDNYLADGPGERDILSKGVRNPGWSVSVGAFRLKDLRDVVYRIARQETRVKVVDTSEFNSMHGSETQNTKYFAMSALLHQGFYSQSSGEDFIRIALLEHEFGYSELAIPNPYGSNVVTTHYTAAMCAGAAAFKFSPTGFCG